jgi:hypothetical protein
MSSRFNSLPMDGPEEGFVHWRETGAQLVEQQIDAQTVFCR